MTQHKQQVTSLLKAIETGAPELNESNLVEAAKHYPCAKKAWIEFLGEHQNLLIDRVA